MPDRSTRAALPPLPIDDAIPALRHALAREGRDVLQAPPGAGKTTRVPLALLGEPWLGDAKVVRFAQVAIGG